MSLFTTSYLPSSSFSDIDQSSLDASLTGSEKSFNQKHQNFVRVLQYAVTLETRILPLTWEPGLEKLGQDGATGSVNQNLLNSQVMFAFKRFKPYVSDPRLSEEQFRDLQYDALITELIILSCPAIQNHDNIAVFVGLCFELSPVSDEVWPVLVFSKSNGGDLASFIQKNNSVGPELLLGICGEIAKGINILHHCGVVHGDIKPSNVLVSQDLEQDAMSITVSDFGFSRFGTCQDDFVQVTRTEPWEAPEWSHREFKLKDAKKLDIYSFGLLCLWLFFGDKTLDDWDLSSATLHTTFAKTNKLAFDEFQSNKHRESLILLLAKGLVKKHEFSDNEIGSRLDRVFDLTLANNPNERASSMEELTEILCGDTYQSEFELVNSPTMINLPQWHGSLQIENLFFHLESCDYRVHSCLTRALEEMADGKGCGICTSNAAFQLAICYTIGFGTGSNEGEANKWLDHDGREKTDLTTVLQRIKESNQRSALLANLAKFGWRYDLPSRYSREGLLVETIDYYRRTALTRSRLFGPGNFSTLRLEGILANLLRWNNQKQEAFELIYKMMEISASLAQSDQIEIKTELARVLAELGDTQRAIDLEKEIIETYANGPERDHAERLDNQQNLVELLVKQCQHAEAIKLAEKTLQECLQELGPLHSSTRGAWRCLAAAYNSNGQLERSVEVGEALVAAGEKFLIDRKPNPKLVEDTSRLGVQYYLLGKQESARICYTKVQDFIKISSDMAKPAVNAVNNYATELIRKESLGLAITILEALLPESTKALGLETQETAMVMGNLAYIYGRQERFDLAEPLERQVVEIRRNVLGGAHDNTITAMGNLRATLLAQKRYQEAAVIGREEVSLVKSHSRVSSSEIINAIQTVARSLESAGAFTEAIKFLEEEIVLGKGTADGPSPGISTAMARAALCYVHDDTLGRARELTVNFLLRMQHGIREDLEEYILVLLRLAQLYLEKSYVHEAEQVLVGVLLLLRQNPSIPQYLKTKVEALMSKYLQQQDTEIFNVIFNPSALLEQS